MPSERPPPPSLFWKWDSRIQSHVAFAAQRNSRNFQIFHDSFENWVTEFGC